MKKKSLRNAIIVSCAGVFCLASGLFAQGSEIVVHDAWIRMPAPAQKNTALYFVVENHGSAQKAIVSASTEAANKVEMHEEKMDAAKKMMSMTPVKQITIPANGKVFLQPGGFHMMLFDLKSKLAMGTMVPVTVKLDDGTTVPVMAAVRDQGEPMKDMTKKQ